MKLKIKRFTYLAFSVVLTLSLFVVSVFAADDNDFTFVDVGEWTLYRYVTSNGTEANNNYYALTSNPVVAKYADYKYTGKTKDSDNNTLVARLIQYDSNNNFLRSTAFIYSNDYIIHVEPDCAYVRFEINRNPTVGIYVTLSDIDYFEVCGSGVGPIMLYYNGEAFSSIIEWIAIVAHAIVSNSILMLFCVALPLCGLGVSMFVRLIRVRG